MAYGYRVDEVPLKPTPEIKEGTQFTERLVPLEEPHNRPVVAVGLGCELHGLARPHGDPNEKKGVRKGIEKRAAMKPPTRDPERMKRLYAFTRRWVRSNFAPIDVGYDFSVEAWLDKTGYPDWRKRQLLTTWNECMNPFSKKYQRIKGFVKDEAYDDWKYLRLINPRDDVFKVLVGPIFKAIEEVVFKYPGFIKGVPRDQWASFISERFMADYETLAMDFEAYEAHLTKELQEVEFIVYDYLLSHVAENVWFKDFGKKVFMGKQEMVYKFFRLVMAAVRASGDQQTSLGNGLVNLIVMLFFAEELGSKVTPAVEGDDSLSQWIGDKPTAEDYASVGLTAKIETHPSPEMASFCGLIFDASDLINIGDPMRAMAKFGWTTRNYMRAKHAKLKMLAKAKAYSTLYQFSGCPVLSSMALWVIRLTKHIDLTPLLNSGALNEYERIELKIAIERHDKLMEVASKRPSMATRLLMEQKFGLSIPRQLMMEKWFEECLSLEPMPSELLVDCCPKSWADYWSRYVHLVGMSEDFDSPDLM